MAGAIELHKVSYRSRDEKNRAVVLTGLVALPRGGAPKGLIIFNHGTIVNSALAPSRFTGKSNASEAELAVLAFASGGYAERTRRFETSQKTAVERTGRASHSR